jgi:GNAT superfamily N-acetyltransferase
MASTDTDATIRPYQAADQPQVEWLYARTPPAGQIAWRPRPMRESLQRIDEHFVAFWVAVDPHHLGVAIVGMTGLANTAGSSIDPALPPFIEASAATARLHHVAVAPERWRFGIGRRLVETALEWARGDYATVVLDTTPQQLAAVALYGATGFNEVGRSMFGSYELVWFERKFAAAAGA